MKNIESPVSAFPSGLKTDIVAVSIFLFEHSKQTVTIFSITQGTILHNNHTATIGF
jgi:hypothetical protein